MKRKILFLVLLVSFGWAAAYAQNSACPGFHNPTSFNSTAGAAGSWSARVGDRVHGTGGSTGSNVLSTCSRPNKPAIRGNANITSSQYYSGYCQYAACCGYDYYDLHDHRFQINTAADAGLDRLTVNAAGVGMQRIPPGHTTSIRLGDPRTTGTCVYDINTDGNNKGSEALFYTMRVNTQNSLLFIDYAIVARRYDHTPTEAGEFIIRVCGKNNSTGQWNNFPLTDSLWYNVPAPAITGALPAPWLDGQPGSSCSATTCGYCYKPWARVAISLIDYLYDSVRVEMYTSDCVYDVDPIYAYIAGSCQPMQITSSGCPGGESDVVDTLRAPEGLLTYTWYVSANGYDGMTSNTEVMDAIPFREVQATSTNNVYVVRQDDYIASEGPNAGDTVPIQTFKCVMTSAMDPAKPFHSKLYATVSNTKPIINANINTDCDGTITLEGLGRVPYQGAGAPHLVDSVTQWVVYEGSTADTPPVDTVYGRLSSFSDVAAGTHAIRLTMYTEDSACYTSKVFRVQVSRPAENKISIDKRTLCIGDVATITDQTEGIVSRQWVFEDTIIDSRAAGMTETRMIVRDFPNFENPFMLITTTNAGCLDTLYDTIYFFSNPEVYFSNDTVICNGHESHVKISTPVEGCTFDWFRHNNQPGENPICSGNTLYVRPTQPHTKYYVRITAPSGCTAWDSVTLSLISTKITADPPSARHCPGDSVTLTGSGALWYEWTAYPGDPDLYAQAHNQTIVVSPSEDTRYYLTGYAADSCDVASINILVQNVPNPIIDFEYSPHYIDSEVPVVNFTDKSQYRDYTSWRFGDGSSTNGQTVTHYFDVYAENCNTVTMITNNALGCSVDTTFSIPIDTFGFYRPNIFTPNKVDNNVFRIVCPSDMDKFHISIFNRQGALVFTSDDQHFEWDGTKNGVPMPQDNYPYVITYTRAGSVSEYRILGTVILIR